jgi:tetratricopeptide (TPR) repeat protein
MILSSELNYPRKRKAIEPYGLINNMSLLGGRVYVHGRIRGLTKRRLTQLAIATGVTLTRRWASADAVVIGHSTAASTLADDGGIHLGFELKGETRLISEMAFRAQMGASVAERQEGCVYSPDQAGARAGLSAAQIHGLVHYDVLRPAGGLHSYRDLLIARSVGRLISVGVKLSKIVTVAHALERRGKSLCNVSLAAAPWGELLQQIDGTFCEIDGQLLLPLAGENIDADKAFSRGETSERCGDLEEARRWYELASKLDDKDGVIPFNLGNVLDSLGQAREAEIAYRQAVARSPDLADAWFNLGVLKEKQRKEDEALASYRAAFAVEPSYVAALHNAALLNMRRSRFEEALALWTTIEATSAAGAEEATRLAQLCRLELHHRSVDG